MILKEFELKMIKFWDKDLLKEINYIDLTIY